MPVFYMIGLCLLLSMMQDYVICRHLLSNDHLEKSFYGSSVTTEDDSCRDCDNVTIFFPEWTTVANRQQNTDQPTFHHMRKNNMPRQTNNRPFPSHYVNDSAFARKEELQRGTLTGTVSRPGAFGEEHSFTCDKNSFCYLTDAVSGKKTYYRCHRMDCEPV